MEQSFLTGCGAFSRGGPKSEADSGYGAALGLRILKSGADSAYPDLRATEARQSFEDQVSMGDETVFKNIISLDDKATFLVWNEMALGPPIREVFYEHRIQNGQNQVLGEVDRWPASFDEKNRNWFIPILKLVKGAYQNANPMEVHLLNLDLFLANSERVRVKVRLRLSGPLPKITLQNLGKDSRALSVQDFVGDAQRGGKLVLSEKVTNFTERPLYLWVRAQGPSQILTLFTGFLGVLDTGVTKISERYRFTHAFYLDLVRIGSSVREAREIKLAGQWIVLDFSPHESVTLNWIASAHPRDQTCAPPPFNPTLQQLKTTPEGAALFGGWAHEILLTAEHRTSEPEVESSEKIYGGTQEVGIQVGYLDFGSKITCEGVIQI